MAITHFDQEEQREIREIVGGTPIEEMPEVESFTDSDLVPFIKVTGDNASPVKSAAVIKATSIGGGSGGGEVTGVKGDAEENYRKGNVNITKANIGLGNVENKSASTLSSEIMTSENVKSVLGCQQGGTKYLKEDGSWDTPAGGGGGTGTVTGAKVGSGSIIEPDANGIINLPNYETDAQKNVKPDWNAVSGSAAEILNKPTIPAGVEPSSSTPLEATDNGAVGTDTKFARGDHRHPHDSTKSDKTSTVSTVEYKSDTKKLTKTINGTESDIVTVSTLKSEMGLGNVTNDAQVKRTEMGATNGVATLGNDGKVPSSQLPSYVDDVLEYATKADFPETGESGKIYVDVSTDKSWRWSGTTYRQIKGDLALGETSSTAYRGDHGKIAYDHSQSTHARTDATKVEGSSTNGNIKINGTETTVYTHQAPTSAEIVEALGYTPPQQDTNTTYQFQQDGNTLKMGTDGGTKTSIYTPTFSAPVTSVAGKTGAVTLSKSDVDLDNVGNFKAVSTEASQGLTDTEKGNARTNIGAGTSNFSGSYNDLTDKPNIPCADKSYAPLAHSGLGRKNLELKNGSNILTQQDFNLANTIYVIQYDFDLNDAEHEHPITIPEGCVLEFDGGSLSNGKVIGNYTTINAPIYEIFKSNLIVEGDFNNVEVYPEWFGAKGDYDRASGTGTDDTISIQKCIDFAEIIGGGTVQLGSKEYLVSSLTIKTRTNLKGQGQGATIIRSTTDFRNTDNKVPDNTGIIVYPISMGISVISDMTILGTNCWQNGISVIAKDTVGSSPLAGAYGINENRKALQELQAYKDATIENVYVGRCNYGIICKSEAYRINILNSDVKFCNYGILFSVTDSSIHECYIEHCNYDGLDVTMGNNKISNIKSIWNGSANPLNSYGLKFGGSRNNIVNCEAQDNYCSGIYAYGFANVISNVIANGNGIAKGTEIDAVDNIDGQGLAEWVLNTDNSLFNNCVASNYTNDSDTRNKPKYPVLYKQATQQFGTDIKICVGYLSTLAKKPIYPDFPIKTNIDFVKIEQNFDREKGYKLENQSVAWKYPMADNIETPNMGIICEFIPENVPTLQAIYRINRYNGLFVQKINEGTGLRVVCSLGDRYPNEFAITNIDLSKPIRVFHRATFLGMNADGSSQLSSYACLWYYSTHRNAYLFAYVNAGTTFNIKDGGTTFNDYKPGSIGFRRNVSYFNPESISGNTIYLRKLLATYDNCIPETVSYPGYPLHSLKAEFSFDWLSLRTDSGSSYIGPTTLRPTKVSNGASYYDETIDLPIQFVRNGWGNVNLVPIGNVTPIEGGTAIVENTINANNLEPGTIGIFMMGDGIKGTYNYPFGVCYIVTLSGILTSYNYMTQIAVSVGTEIGGGVVNAKKGIMYRTKYAGVWSDWMDSLVPSQTNN